MWIWDKHGQGKVTKKPKAYLALDKFPVIQGYNFGKPFNSQKFFQQYLHMGLQGSHLGIGIKILQEMLLLKQRGKKMKIFLACTGNMISSGNRELITYLVKEKLVDCIVTTAAGIEEDLIKCIKPFHLGNFDVKGSFLQDESIGRIGNIFVPYDRYLYFERVLNGFFSLVEKEKTLLSTEQFCSRLGNYLAADEYTKTHGETSFLYWASKNHIPVFCPGITDGAIGDIATFFKKKHPSFTIDVIQDNVALTDLLLNAELAGSLILGGGIAKHFLLNAAIFRDGFDYSIYLTTAGEFDGSDSGGNQEEAISWSKIKPEAKRIKIVADATITFPLLMAGGLSGEQKNGKE
jgi:deoxyhypusine synthase